MSISNPMLLKFDELFTGNPEDIESNLSKLLPEAMAMEDKSIYLQILSQIALAQAMQQRFEVAHSTLDQAESLLQPEYELARIRILLERGRVYHQSGDFANAKDYFMRSYELSKLNHEFDFHTVNAAHMIPMVVGDVSEKIDWNNTAIDLANETNDERCKSWLGSLYNNIAQNYIEAEDYDRALKAFQKCMHLAEERGDSIVVRGARWGIARAYRSLGKIDEAFIIQNSLLDEYKKLSEEGAYPNDFIALARGVVYEELSELYHIQGNEELTKRFAKLAYDDFMVNPMMQTLFPERVKRALIRSG